VGRVRLVETHISWVLLTGDYAYKVKKPVDLGFANFSTLALRRRYCEEELRLNRRLAPEIYLEVVALRETGEGPRIAGKGKILDYAVKMRQFPQSTLASRALVKGRFGPSEIDDLAATIAAFHTGTPPAPAGGPPGTPAAVLASALQNFDQMLPLLRTAQERKALEWLRQWTEREHAVRHDAFQSRKSGGFIRECHGDLHLGNIALLHRRPVPFDCIEFSEELRCIDVMSEIAFLAMDLVDRHRADLAWRFLNRYLEATGDYRGIAVLRFYLVYRALVRAKVHIMRAHQPRLGRTEKERLLACFRGYLKLAKELAASHQGALILAHGLSGSGKTTATQSLIEQAGAIRLRSDVERKRMHGLDALATSGSGLAAGLYTPARTAAVYRQLGTLAREIARAGYPVVVDATFLRRTEREAFRALAEHLGAPFVILDFRAPLAVLRARVAARHSRGDDASEADLTVLERQIAAREPLTPGEIAASVVVKGVRPPAAHAWQRVIKRAALM
jgi:aminoglycoside phosphotransferase family enzyme/predicted kinase